MARRTPHRPPPTARSLAPADVPRRAPGGFVHRGGAAARAVAADGDDADPVVGGAVGAGAVRAAARAVSCRPRWRTSWPRRSRPPGRAGRRSGPGCSRRGPVSGARACGGPGRAAVHPGAARPGTADRTGRTAAGQPGADGRPPRRAAGRPFRPGDRHRPAARADADLGAVGGRGVRAGRLARVGRAHRGRAGRGRGARRAARGAAGVVRGGSADRRRYWRHVFGTRLGGQAAITVPDLRGVLAAVVAGAGITVLPAICAWTSWPPARWCRCWPPRTRRSTPRISPGAPARRTTRTSRSYGSDCCGRRPPGEVTRARP
jgi:hypothetical protein